MSAERTAPTPTYAVLKAERDAHCLWTVGPIPKQDMHTCFCDRLNGHPGPHECPCGAWFEGCGRDGRVTA